MRLTLMLLKRRNVMPGNKWIGKHQLPVVAHPWSVEAYKKRVQLEEQNLFYLRHPYLTLAQEQGHGKALNKPEKWLHSKKLLKAARKIQPSIRMEKDLGHLNVSCKWEL